MRLFIVPVVSLLAVGSLHTVTYAIPMDPQCQLVHLPKPDPHRPPSDSQHDSESHLLSHNPQPSLAADDDAHSTQSEYYYGNQDDSEDHQDDQWICLQRPSGVEQASCGPIHSVSWYQCFALMQTRPWGSRIGNDLGDARVCVCCAGTLFLGKCCIPWSVQCLIQWMLSEGALLGGWTLFCGCCTLIKVMLFCGYAPRRTLSLADTLLGGHTPRWTFFSGYACWWTCSLVDMLAGDTHLSVYTPWWTGSPVDMLAGDMISVNTRFGGHALWWIRSSVDTLFGGYALRWIRSSVDTLFGGYALWWIRSLVDTLFGGYDMLFGGYAHGCALWWIRYALWWIRYALWWMRS
ncbi:hypothetical protein F5878DRAFT_645701 [Lentinula raphanica]|uniref:Uncharacterized protein n=1 Tax=Lentinula raphanica TaxID=153919 RepID=A0AA38P054_9AGAR|nr:hypothetical protein F5878DRAFT_645701 [Lentinula raphanica]